MADHGVAYRKLYQLQIEQIRAIKEIWTTDEPEFYGKFVNFDKMKAFHKPYQHSHPPIIMGGGDEKAIEFAAELYKSWAPWGMEWTKIKEAITDLKKQATSNGRDPIMLEISLFSESIPDKKIIKEMEPAGVKGIRMTIFGQSLEQALPTLDILAKINR
jgi:alkanesulfonate monooxygenase SsuD/methylene tetrahydromethanopterin reductase-like flavin-dependent oxidoreductase (luciferase family)